MIDIVKKRAVIFDIDGTLSEGCGTHRGPYEYSKVALDKPNDPIVEIAKRYINDPDIKIIIISGRENTCMVETEDWLKRNGLFYDQLYMRPEGNREQDSTVKQQIYNDYIKKYFNVMFVLEDRSRVVDMWRSLGLTCLQVGDGNF